MCQKATQGYLSRFRGVPGPSIFHGFLKFLSNFWQFLKICFYYFFACMQNPIFPRFTKQVFPEKSQVISIIFSIFLLRFLPENIWKLICQFCEILTFCDFGAHATPTSEKGLAITFLNREIWSQK